MGMKEKVGGIKNYIAEMFTGIIVIALAIYSFVGIGLKDAIDNTFWVSFAVNLGIMILVTSVWYPSAKSKAQIKDEGYLAQRKKYGELVQKIVDTNNQKNLKIFCDYATEQNRIFKIKQALVHINVDYDVYQKYLKEPFKIKDDQSLSKKQKKNLLKLIQNGVRVKRISHSKIITGIKESKLQYDTISGETKYDVFKLTSKIFISVCSSIFMAYIAFSLFGFTWESVAQLFTWLIMICWNIFTSYTTGYKSISIKRADYYKKLKTYLEEFVSSEYFDRNNNIVSRETLNGEEILENV